MPRTCAICGKLSMGGFNPQSSGMNRMNKGEPRQLICNRCRRTLQKTA
jgi:hypothetical protein